MESRTSATASRSTRSNPGGPLPEDRELLYPWVGFELVEDRFQERTNQDQILRTEDVLVGLRAGGRLGVPSTAPDRIATR
jgi:hypothetical protein